MTKFKIFFNVWDNSVQCSVLGIGVSKEDAGKPVEVFGDLRPNCVPLDIWKDFCNAWEEEREIENTLLYKRINPVVPAKFRKAHNFSFIIEGDGFAQNYLAKVQSDGPYARRFPTDIEGKFKEWFIYLCKQKFKITPR